MGTWACVCPVCCTCCCLPLQVPLAFGFCSQSQMLSPRSEGQVQPLLFTFCSGVSACGCSPGPVSFPEAAVGWDMGQTAPHVMPVPCPVLLQHRPHFSHLVQCRADAAEQNCTPVLEEALALAPQNPGQDTCKHHSAREGLFF